jgi:2-isopropylmalate synthase
LFKRTADAKKNLIDEDLVALLDDGMDVQSIETFAVQSVQVVSGAVASSGSLDAPVMATATVCLIDQSTGATLVDAAIGQGPVNAIFKCINRLVGVQEDTVLVDYEVKSVTEGTDALGKVTVRLCPAPIDECAIVVEPILTSDTKRKRVFQGHGTHWDILTASAKAYVSAVNRMLNAQKY